MSKKPRRQKGLRARSSPASSNNPLKVLFLQGLALQEQAKLPEAGEIYRRVLDSDPKYLDARNNLGNVLRDTGDIDGSIVCYLDVLAIDPGYALAHFNLGNARRKEGKYEEAAACYRRTLDIRPNFANACNNLGVTLQDLDRLEEAIPWLYRAIAADKRYALAHLNLGNALRSHGKLDEAEACFRAAIKIDPRYIDARCNLSSVLRAQCRLDESMACLKTARKMDSKSPLIQFGIAETLHQQGKLEAAITAFQRAIEFDPNNANFHNNKGNALRLLERMEEAQESYRKAMKLDPDHPDAVMNFAIEQPYAPDDPNFARLKVQLSRKNTTEDKRIQLIFALARGYDAAGRYDDAMAYFTRGNALKAKKMDFSRQENQDLVKKIRNFSTEARPLEHADASSGQQIPVFLLGLSRSGKTLAESLLKQDARVFGAGERRAFLDAIDKIREEQGIADTFPDCALQLDDAMIADMGVLYMTAMGKLANTAFVVNTLPGMYLYLDLIFQAMPSARVIYCRRDPLDQCLRIFFKLYATRNTHAYSFEDIVAFHNGYHELMGHWQGLYGARILNVQYEDMVRDPRATAEKLFAHLGLEVNTDALEAQFSTHEIGQWRNYKEHIGQLRVALSELIF